MEQPGGLISVLLDRGAPDGDRDDAAMDLGAFDGAEVEAALAEVARDPNEEEFLRDSCEQSLADIRARANAD